MGPVPQTTGARTRRVHVESGRAERDRQDRRTSGFLSRQRPKSHRLADGVRQWHVRDGNTLARMAVSGRAPWNWPGLTGGMPGGHRIIETPRPRAKWLVPTSRPPSERRNTRPGIKRRGIRVPRWPSSMGHDDAISRTTTRRGARRRMRRRSARDTSGRPGRSPRPARGSAPRPGRGTTSPRAAPGGGGPRAGRRCSRRSRAPRRRRRRWRR